MNIIVTMIAPSQGGAGDYLLEVKNQFNEFLLISPVNPNFSNELLNKLFIESQKIILKLLIFLTFPFIKLDKVVVYHPQTLGYRISSYLIRNASYIYYFVLDASIFCIKSYNNRNEVVCTNCIKQISPYKDCNFFPRKNSLIAFRKHRERIFLELYKIEFIVQTAGYKNIVKGIFGKKANCRILKMKFPSIKVNYLQNLKKKYDFVYHGNNLEAKGSTYALRIASSFSKYNFFFPYHIDRGGHNVVSKSISWDKGLIEVILKSKIVLCPSIWSAPVEGAVIKTMMLMVPVAIHINKYSASMTLLPKDCFIPLTGILREDLRTLESFLNDEKKLLSVSDKAFKWVKNYIDG